MTNDLEGLSLLEPELIVATISNTGSSVIHNEVWKQILGAGSDWAFFTDTDRDRACAFVEEAKNGVLVTNQMFFSHILDRVEPLPVLLNFIPVQVHTQKEKPTVVAVTIVGEVLREPGTWTQSQTQRNRLETLGRMTMGIAHDFNNLLSGILGYTELLKTYVADEAPAASFDEHLQTIEQAAMDGASLIQKIQRFIRQEKHTHFEPLDLTDLIKDCITLTRPYWYNEPRRQGIAIGIEDELEDIPLVMGSATELREVIINLILNAVQAMPQGGTITFQTKRRDGDTVCVSITDTGTGMPESILSKIFEPLYTTKGDRGTGMGLAVSYGIVQEHEGDIRVESEPGAGSTFTLSFPISTESIVSTPAAEELQPTISARILVVDDEPMVRTILDKLLTMKGHQVVQAASGTEALDIIEQQQFDIIVTDHGMPEMSGSELSRKLRSRYPDLPVILLTGDTEVSAASEHVSTVFSKPFKIEELQATIHDLVQ